MMRMTTSASAPVSRPSIFIWEVAWEGDSRKERESDETSKERKRERESYVVRPSRVSVIDHDLLAYILAASSQLFLLLPIHQFPPISDANLPVRRVHCSTHFLVLTARKQQNIIIISREEGHVEQLKQRFDWRAGSPYWHTVTYQFQDNGATASKYSQQAA